MNDGWFRVRGAASPFGVRYYGLPIRLDDLGANVPCSASAVYCVPWYTGPGGQIDEFVVRFSTTASVSGRLGIFAANHVRMPTPGGLLVQTSVALTSTITTASVGFIAAANAMMYLALHLEESRTFDGPLAPSAFATMGFDTTSMVLGYYGLVCSYAFTAGFPATLAIPGVTRLGDDRVPFIGVHYA